MDEADVARVRAETPVNDDEEKALREQDAARLGGAWLKQLRAELKSPMERVGAVLRKLGWTPESIAQPLNNSAPLPPDAKWDALLQCIVQRLRNDRDKPNDERLIVFAGFRFHAGMALSEMMRPGDALALVAERENPHDPRAVRLDFGDMHVGYVPRDHNTIIATLLVQCAPIKCRIVSITPDSEPWKMIEAEIRLVRCTVSHLD